MKEALKYLKNTYGAIIVPVCHNTGYDVTIKSDDIIRDATSILIDMLNLYNIEVVAIRDGPFSGGKFLIFESGNINLLKIDETR